MKALHVINSLGGSGGAEHGLVREITRFSNRTTNVVVRLFHKDALDDVLTSQDIPVIPLGRASGRAGWNWPIATAQLVQIIRREKPDVIHSSLFAANLVAQLAGRLTGVPVVSTFTLSGKPDLLRAYQPGAETFRARMLRALAGWAARSPQVWFRALTDDALVTNSELLRVPQERGTVIPRGVPPTFVPDRPMSRDELGLPDGPIILNIGRQTAQKGHTLLVRAFAQFRETNPAAHLVILGRSGDASFELNAEINRHNLERGILLVGYTPLTGHYLAHADLFVFTSLMEGLGTAVLEAMSAGLPVIAFDIPPVHEVAHDVASLVPVQDVDALVSEMVRLMDDPKARRDMGRTGQARVRKRFSIDKIAAQLERLLTEVAEHAS